MIFVFDEEKIWRKRSFTYTFKVLPSSLLKIKRRHKIKRG